MTRLTAPVRKSNGPLPYVSRACATAEEFQMKKLAVKRMYLDKPMLYMDYLKPAAP